MIAPAKQILEKNCLANLPQRLSCWTFIETSKASVTHWNFTQVSITCWNFTEVSVSHWNFTPLSAKRVQFQQMAETSPKVAGTSREVSVTGWNFGEVSAICWNFTRFVLKVQQDNRWRVGQTILLSILPSGAVVLFISRSLIQQIYRNLLRGMVKK